MLAMTNGRLQQYSALATAWSTWDIQEPSAVAPGLLVFMRYALRNDAQSLLLLVTPLQVSMPRAVDAVPRLLLHLVLMLVEAMLDLAIQQKICLLLQGK